MFIAWRSKEEMWDFSSHIKSLRKEIETLEETCIICNFIFSTSAARACDILLCLSACLSLFNCCSTETLPGECEPMWRALLIDSHCFSQVLESSSFPSSARDAGALSGRPATFLNYYKNVLCLKDLKTAGNKYHYITLLEQVSTLVYSNTLKKEGYMHRLKTFSYDIFDLECACFRIGGTKCWTNNNLFISLTCKEYPLQTKLHQS